MRKRTPAKKKAKIKEPEAAATNTSDWSLYRSVELIKVGEYKDGTVLIKRETGEIEKISYGDLAAKYEPVKGLHKRGDF